MKYSEAIDLLKKTDGVDSEVVTAIESKVSDTLGEKFKANKRLEDAQSQLSKVAGILELQEGEWEKSIEELKSKAGSLKDLEATATKLTETEAKIAELEGQLQSSQRNSLLATVVAKTGANLEVLKTISAEIDSDRFQVGEKEVTIDGKELKEYFSESPFLNSLFPTQVPANPSPTPPGNPRKGANSDARMRDRFGGYKSLPGVHVAGGSDRKSN